ncbi:MAG: universal stress protein [Proteobacteria bacterium]|nr:universal stress protein [Pseudomonadota bacterium]
MYQRILVPIDGSETAGLGLAEALRLAKALGARLRIVHVVDDLLAFAGPELAVHADEFLAKFRERSHALLAAAEGSARAQGVAAESHCREVVGEPVADGIVAEAREWQADLIVLGTHGRRGLRRLALGSDAAAVVSGAEVPVLLVRAAPGR